MKNKIVEVIVWILFWFCLIPYYLIKEFLFKRTSHPILWTNCVTLDLFLALGLATSPNTRTTGHQSTQETTLAKSKKVAHKTATETVTKRVGTGELSEEEARAKILTQEEKDKRVEYDKLKKQFDNYQEEEEKQKREAEQERKATEVQAQKEAAVKKKETEEAQRKAQQNQEANNDSSSSQGDLYTANQGTTVGNCNSMIYHVPGQTGYHMHSANAVYFNSKQDAINTGYGKAKR